MRITVGIKNVPFHNDLERRIIRGIRDGRGVGRLRGCRPATGQERMQTFTRTPALPIKQRICSDLSPIPGLARGQDSPLCEQTQKAHPERKPVTTPPANNHGQSAPPRARH